MKRNFSSWSFFNFNTRVQMDRKKKKSQTKANSEMEIPVGSIPKKKHPAKSPSRNYGKKKNRPLSRKKK